MLDEETKKAILAEASGGLRAKRIADRLPAWRNPPKPTKRTATQRKRRKARRKRAASSKKRNRKK